jgi:HD-like signal output (HDOD) protein
MAETCFDRISTLELLSFAEDLPSLPDRFVKIQSVIQNPDSGAEDLANIIRSDQAVSAMVLKVANSVSYNPTGTPICELSKAIARLGSRETAHITTAMSLMYGMILPTGMANIRIFWGHAFAVALVAERLSHVVDPAQQTFTHECVFMAGLMHDIGRAALGMRVDFSYFERETGHLHQSNLIQAEEQYYGVNHAEAGELLLRAWGFPESLSNAVGEYYKPESKLPMARICGIANDFVLSNVPERTPFEAIQTAVHLALEENPPDLSELLTVA